MHNYTHTHTQTIIYTKNASYQKEARAFYRQHVRKAFIHWLYYKGLFPTKNLPPYLNIHHKHPLGGGGSNDFSNLVILTKADHKRMNEKVFDPQLDGIQEGESREIEVPWWNEYVDWKGIKRYLAMRKMSENRRNR